MTFMPFGAFLMEFVVVRINWEHILAFAPIINDGNIYGTKNVYFCNTFLQFYAKIFLPKKAMIRLALL